MSPILIKRKNRHRSFSSDNSYSDDDSDCSSSDFSYDDKDDRNYLFSDRRRNQTWMSCLKLWVFTIKGKFVWVNLCLLGSLLVFSATLMIYYWDDHQEDTAVPRFSYGKGVKHPALEVYQRAHGRTDEEMQKLHQDAIDALLTKVPNNKRKKRSVEALTTNCVLQSWQELNLPNCNSVHEFYLPEVLAYDYAGAGLFRSVWRISEHEVIKMLKMDQEFNDRNLDRHRRDALGTERLTSNKNVVDIYSFCGHTAVSEYLPLRLYDLIYPKYETKRFTTKRKKVTPPPIVKFSMKTKLQIAMQVMRGLDAIHSLNGPIVHADIAAKQFLIQMNHNFHDLLLSNSKKKTKNSRGSGRDGRGGSDENDGSGDDDGSYNDGSTVNIYEVFANNNNNRLAYQVKLNDLNRCRFMAKNNHAEKYADNPDYEEYCPVRIPSAPGSLRSPEEYNESQLTTKIDVYSAAHIFYGILHGQDPTKSRGFYKMRPPDVYYRSARMTELELRFANVTSAMYELDPKSRPSAREVLTELKNLLQLVD